jgi:hypothetical protein
MGDIDIVNILLEQNADVNKVSGYGSNALNWCKLILIIPNSIIY